jgi:excisionase family DNA binding protein
MGVQWLTVNDTAKFLGITTDHVRQLSRRGQLATERTLGGQRLFSRLAVEGFLRNRMEKARARGASNYGRPERKPKARAAAP